MNKVTCIKDIYELAEDDFIMPIYSKGNIEVCFYGGEISSVTIDSKDIIDLFNLKIYPNYELEHFLTDEAIAFIIDKVNEAEENT